MVVIKTIPYLLDISMLNDAIVTVNMAFYLSIFAPSRIPQSQNAIRMTFGLEEKPDLEDKKGLTIFSAKPSFAYVLQY